jgi:hypothetical protein
MTGLIVILLINAVLVTFIFALVCAASMKWLARGLTFKQAFLIALPAHAIAIFVTVVYYTAKVLAGIPSIVDGPVTFVALSVAGTLMTRGASNNGVQKTGYVGIGAKAILLLMLSSWILAAIVFGIISLQS